MLDERLKFIERLSLNDEMKSKQFQTIQQQLKKQKLKQTYSYSATIVLFIAVLFIFVQTMNSTKIETVQQATTFELGDIKKATYLFSQRPEKMYDLTSPFYIDKLSTTNPEALQDFKEYLDGVEMKPFTRSISEFSEATNYLFELKNGESVYLKSFYEDEQMIFIDPSSMMELAVTKEANSFTTWWALLYVEDKQVPKWKIALIIFSVIVIFFYEKIFRIKLYPTYQNSIWINVCSYISWLAIVYWTTRWLGTTHLLFLLFAVTTCFIVLELLYALFRLKPFIWKEHILILITLNLLITVLFL